MTAPLPGKLEKWMKLPAGMKRRQEMAVALADIARVLSVISMTTGSPERMSLSAIPNASARFST
jgi:hypothetical protein